MIDNLNEIDSVQKYLARVGAEPRSLLKAVVKQDKGNGYYDDLAVIRFTKQGDVDAPTQYEPNDDERAIIKAEFAAIKWPEAVFIPENDPALPEKAKDAFWFRDINGNILMGQVRIVNKTGAKSYVPITKWDDGQYRWLELDGQLPLFGMEQLKDYSTVFLHEGCKGAIVGQKVVSGEIKDHPWQQELSAAAHLAWIGGALSPHRTDWSVLKKHGVTRVYIVSDNDEPGKASIPKIAEELACLTMSIEFSDEFPKSFDLGDDFPAKMFRSIKEKRYYVGPSFRDCLNFSTWMTNVITVTEEKNGKAKEKKVPVLRHHAKNLWAYLDELELFVNMEFPEIIRKKEALDAMLSVFSNTRRVSELILQSYNGRTPKLTYRPDVKGRRVLSDGETAINTYVPPHIRPVEGDVSPFLEFMAYLVPNEKECHNLKRWCATLIARPEIRMKYGVLLISEMAGTGKTTLSEKVLAPLLGHNNVSYPSETQITASDFNSWLSKKRLAICNEIYAGSNFKAANKLKSIITDKYIEVNEKFLPTIRLENFISIFASSNSLKALKIESSDRRWFIPTVNEERWPDSKFQEFNDWLDSGGLHIVCHWAHNFKDYVGNGEIAPDSRRKREMIEDGMSEAQSLCASLGKMMMEHPDPVALGFRDIKLWLSAQEIHKTFDSDQELKKAMKGVGIVFSDKRVSIKGIEQALAFNSKALDRLKEFDDSEKMKRSKDFIKMPNEIIGEAF